MRSLKVHALMYLRVYWSPYLNLLPHCLNLYHIISFLLFSQKRKKAYTVFLTLKNKTRVLNNMFSFLLTDAKNATTQGQNNNGVL